MNLNPKYYVLNRSQIKPGVSCMVCESTDTSIRLILGYMRSYICNKCGFFFDKSDWLE